jgi:nucleoid DNA-binding protein
MKKFSYKDFIDGITVKLPYDKSHSRRVSPKMVNMVWKETVKYIIAELQHNREVYLPYIGYISLKEQEEDLRVPFYKGTSKTQRVKNFDYVEFKPFKIFLDILNKMDANDDKALNKLIDSYSYYFIGDTNISLFGTFGLSTKINLLAFLVTGEYMS